MDTEIHLLYEHSEKLHEYQSCISRMIKLTKMARLAEDVAKKADREEQDGILRKKLRHKEVAREALGQKLRGMDHGHPDYEDTQKKAKEAIETVRNMILQCGTIALHRREVDKTIEQYRMAEDEIGAKLIGNIAIQLSVSNTLSRLTQRIYIETHVYYTARQMANHHSRRQKETYQRLLRSRRRYKQVSSPMMPTPSPDLLKLEIQQPPSPNLLNFRIQQPSSMDLLKFKI
jgi:chaperonin cofactor prefoldin